VTRCPPLWRPALLLYNDRREDEVPTSAQFLVRAWQLLWPGRTFAYYSLERSVYALVVGWIAFPTSGQRTWAGAANLGTAHLRPSFIFGSASKPLT
jgi:hypothetical protein